MSEDKNFEFLEKELRLYKKMMGKAADIILEKEVSRYPIFVIHQHDVEIGIPIATRENTAGNWNVNASSMEEFISKSVIESEKIDGFKNVYKDPETHLCLFVISELGAKFIFMAR